MIRGLKSEDAPLMLEWMLDSSVVKMMNRNFSEMTLEDCNSFIEKNKLPSDVDKDGLVEELKKRGCAHLAIVDISDEYLGTVSLKNIDTESGTAEFAITIRSSAMGTGASAVGMSDILTLGHREMGLGIIYWYVNKENQRAIKFYDKCSYTRCTVSDLERFGVKLEDDLKNNPSYQWYVDIKEQ